MHTRTGEISLSLQLFAIVFSNLRNEEITYSRLGRGPWDYIADVGDQYPHFFLAIPVTKICFQVSMVFLFL